jgi:hypothetical protein
VGGGAEAIAIDPVAALRPSLFEIAAVKIVPPVDVARAHSARPESSSTNARSSASIR